MKCRRRGYRPLIGIPQRRRSSRLLTASIHHHFICDRCGNVEDVDWYDVPRPAAASLGKRVLRECERIFRG